jgi:ABC-type molybdate transport system substrate-binding protein
MRALALGFLGAVALAPGSARAAEPVLLHAAGSLREALSEVARLFEASTEGARVDAKFAASGLLRNEIAGGARAEVFASANMEHPLSLTESKRAGPTVLFARNRLCALLRPGLATTPDTLLDTMLDAGIKVGTSTPKADPSGDYAFEVFRKADDLKAGSRDILAQKALQLTGGPDSPRLPADRSIYGLMIASGRADIFLTYCTNAQVAAREVPGARAVALPESLSVGADYGLAVMAGSPERAYRFAFTILSGEGQSILARHGFEAPSATGVLK